MMLAETLHWLVVAPTARRHGMVPAICTSGYLHAVDGQNLHQRSF
jgi:hypothetical protein